MQSPTLGKVNYGRMDHINPAYLPSRLYIGLARVIARTALAHVLGRNESVG